MSWFSEFAGKAENFLNKIDQTTANVLNISNDEMSNRINDNNEFENSSNQSIANSQSLPQLKSIFVSTGPESELNEYKSDFKYGHSRDSSIASYHGLTMKDTSTMNKNSKFLNTRRTIDDGQLFDYLNNKHEDLNHTLNNQLTFSNGDESSISSNQSFLTADKNDQSYVSNGLHNPITSVLSVESKQSQSEAIKKMLKEEKHKLNELKIEYKKHTQSLNNEIHFLKDKLDQHLVKKDSRGELDSVKEQLKVERGNREKFEKEILILSTSFSSLKSEFEEYKVRAQRTLQTKDSLIEQIQQQLDQQNVHKVKHTSDRKLEEDCQILLTTNQNLRQELQEIKYKYLKSKEQLDAFSNERDDLENQLKQNQLELNTSRASQHQVADELERLRIVCRQNENELNKLRHENQLELDHRQQQINELNDQLASLSENKWSQQGIPQDLELKIKNLTENLLCKQTLVENLKREKNSLVLQLEDSKRQMCNLQNKNSNYYISFKENISERNRNDTSNSDSSYNTPVARRVRKAYSQLDQFSHQITFFIRAYPLAQKLLLAYIISLHFFVFFILFSSKPET